MLQNRRNDLFFEPDIKAFNVVQFASFIQADGYNPLNIAGLAFHYEGAKIQQELDEFLKHPFSPGQLLNVLKSLEKETLFYDILKESRVSFCCTFPRRVLGRSFYIYL